jgi:hypothetical protein
MTSKVNLKRCNYLGEIDSKSQLLLNCYVVLCTENGRYEFSEKLIDALRFGKVPFYVGPNLERLGIANAIYFYGGTNVRSARQALKLVNSFSINNKLIALEKFREKVMSRWEQDIAFKKLCRKINLVLV